MQSEILHNSIAAMSCVVYYPLLVNIDDVPRLVFITVKISLILREHDFYIWITSWIQDMINVLLENSKIT